MSGLQDPAIISFAELVLRPRFQVERNPQLNQRYALIDGFYLFFEIKGRTVIGIGYVKTGFTVVLRRRKNRIALIEKIKNPNSQ